MVLRLDSGATDTAVGTLWAAVTCVTDSVCGCGAASGQWRHRHHRRHSVGCRHVCVCIFVELWCCSWTVAPPTPLSSACELPSHLRFYMDTGGIDRTIGTLWTAVTCLIVLLGAAASGQWWH